MTTLFSFEGIDGVGKTTVIEAVKQKLDEQGYRVIILREPGSTQLGEKIRDILKSNTPRRGYSEMLLFQASRSEMIETYLKDNTQNDIVLIDRYIDSTVAYQGYGEGHNLEFINIVNDYVTRDYQPVKTFYITVPQHISEERRQVDGREVDKLDGDVSFRQRVINGYQDVVENNPERIVIVENIHLHQAVDKIIEEIENYMTRMVS